MRPSQVTKANVGKVWNTLYGSDVDERVRFKFEVGDRVRISKVKRMFEKSYHIILFHPFINYDAGEILDGTFYESELQKIIKNNYVYRF